MLGLDTVALTGISSTRSIGSSCRSYVGTGALSTPVTFDDTAGRGWIGVGECDPPAPPCAGLRAGPCDGACEGACGPCCGFMWPPEVKTAERIRCARDGDSRIRFFRRSGQNDRCDSRQYTAPARRCSTNTGLFHATAAGVQGGMLQADRAFSSVMREFPPRSPTACVDTPPVVRYKLRPMLT